MRQASIAISWLAEQNATSPAAAMDQPGAEAGFDSARSIVDAISAG